MKTSSNVARLKKNAEEFHITPELAWLLEAQPLWDAIKEACVLTNRGINLEMLESLDPPLDKLRFDLLSLAALLGERRG